MYIQKGVRMGLFSKISSKNSIENIELQESEAYLAILIHATHIEGEIGHTEYMAMRIITDNHYLLKNDEYFDKIFDKVMLLFNNFGKDSVFLKAINNIEERHKYTVFINYINILLSDGYISPSEEVAAELVRSSLHINQVEATKAIKFTLEILNDFSK